MVAILLDGGILTLYLVTNNNLRPGLICAFTIAFALTIHLFTNARRAELFTSITAYKILLFGRP